MSYPKSIRMLLSNGVAISGLALALVYGGVAQAQDAGVAPPAPIVNGPASGAEVPSASKDAPEIVVTGTLLRNTAAVGTSTIALDPVAIEGTGATSIDKILNQIPQLGTLDQLETVSAGGTQLTVNRINLRQLPQGVGGSSPTLVLMDGHRMVSEGVVQAYPDPDVLPPELIQRVEVVPDGGSAIYGSDAVGGVVNFVTKRDYNGFNVGVRQGFAEDYSSTDAHVTLGKSWDSGSAYIGYDFAYHSNIPEIDRSYIRNINYATGLPQDLTCTKANSVVGGSTYAVLNGSSLALGNQNICDVTKATTLIPIERRHSVMASLRQELSDSLEFTVKGYYSHRSDLNGGAPLVPSAPASITSANPNYINTFDANSGKTQAVSYNFAPVGGYANVTTKLWAYQITPGITWKIDSNWQLRAYYNYGQSSTSANNPEVNPTVLKADVTNGSVNPYNIAASNPAAIASVLDYTNYGVGKDIQHNAKATIDGSLFKLPGGPLKLAVGSEFLYEKFSGTLTTNTYEIALATPFTSASRDVYSGYGEVNIPIIGRDNHIPLIYSLTFDASERYDHYSDFGGNWAPNLAANWKVVNWVTLRGRWNRSYQAPSLVQLSQAGTPQPLAYPASTAQQYALIQNPAVPFIPGVSGPILTVQGTVSPLQPQTARIYDLGFDISPPIAPGLGLHFTYYNIDYKNAIEQPALGSGPFYNVPGYQDLFLMNQTAAQAMTFLEAHGLTAAQAATETVLITPTASGAAGTAYVVADLRARNLGRAIAKGYDMGVDYRHAMPFGSVDASLNGTYVLDSTIAADGVSFLPNQADINQPRFTSVARFGADVGDNFRGQLTWTHRSPYQLAAAVQYLPGVYQTSVGSFDLFDLFFKYDVKEHGMPPISFSLSVNNILNSTPPIYHGNGLSLGTFAAAGPGYANGNTIGRFFQMGASVSF